MAGFVEKLFGSNWWERNRESAGASLAGTGISAATSSITDSTDTGAIKMDAQLSSAGTKYSGKRNALPTASSIDNLVSIIKQVRNQYQVRQMLEDSASFITQGFRVKSGPGKGADCKQFVVETEIETKANRIALELVTIGWVVVYVSELDKQGFPGITLLHNVKVTRGVDGKPHIFLMLSDDAKKAVAANSQAYPKYWQQSLESDDGIEITRVYDKSGKLKQGGAYFVCLEPEGEDVFPISPLYPVLGDAVDSQRMSSIMGDLMDLVKFYWFQIKLGNEKGQDERDGRIKAISKDRVREVGAAFGLGIKTGALLTPGDVTAEHHMPETSPWALPRSEREILKGVFQDQTGLPKLGEASSDAAAMALARGYLPRVEKLRAILLNKFILPFLADVSKRFPQMEGSYPILSEDGIQDLGTTIQKHRQLLSTGAYSLQTLNEILDPDYDFDREIARKTYEEGFKDSVGNLYEPGQGFGQPDPAPAPAAPTTDNPKGKVGDPKSADPKTLANPSSQPGRPSK